MDDTDKKSEREWHCRACGTLLGIERAGKMFLKYKTAQFVVIGTVMAICRRCADLNETTCPSSERVAHERAARSRGCAVGGNCVGDGESGSELN